MKEMWVWSLGQEDPLEKRMAPQSIILAWKILWTEEPWWAAVDSIARSWMWLHTHERAHTHTHSRHPPLQGPFPLRVCSPARGHRAWPAKLGVNSFHGPVSWLLASSAHVVWGSGQILAYQDPCRLSPASLLDLYLWGITLPVAPMISSFASFKTYS